MKPFSRRRIMRGMLGGGMVSVTLPFLDCLLKGNGNALASGKPLPVRFGTWVWGLGIDASVFVPKTVGANYELPEEIECLAPVKNLINVFTDYQAFKDGYSGGDHLTGWVATRSGQAPRSGEDRPGETFDVTIANQIGRSTRYKMLNTTATGDVRDSVTYEGQTSVIPVDYSPIAIYERLFGPGYQDPNLPSFTPDPRIMVQKSALSGVMEDIKAFNQHVGAEDKARLEQYFTGLRELERQMDQQLMKPEPREACKSAAGPTADPAAGLETGQQARRHSMITDMLAMAVACDQTRVINMVLTAPSAVTVKEGYEKPHHTATHEEPNDPVLGYQPISSWFIRKSMENWLYFVQAFDKIKEGDGTLLDNMLIVAHSELGLARAHTLDGMGLFTAGRAGGKMKTGLHIAGKGTQVTEIGYTALRVMGLEMESWGTKDNMTSKTIGSILV
jgi:hypothetical protein